MSSISGFDDFFPFIQGQYSKMQTKKEDFKGKLKKES